MENVEITREELFAQLEKDLAEGKPFVRSSYRVRLSKRMDKDEFSSIRKGLGLTQAQLAEDLDLSVKTIQAYEQGRSEVSGLAAKVLRLMNKDMVFRGVFKGEMSSDEYSEYVTMKSFVNQRSEDETKIHLAETLMTAFEEYRSKQVSREINDTGSNIDGFIVFDGVRNKG